MSALIHNFLVTLLAALVTFAFLLLSRHRRRRKAAQEAAEALRDYDGFQASARRQQAPAAYKPSDLQNVYPAASLRNATGSANAVVSGTSAYQGETVSIADIFGDQPHVTDL